MQKVSPLLAALARLSDPPTFPAPHGSFSDRYGGRAYSLYSQHTSVYGRLADSNDGKFHRRRGSPLIRTSSVRGHIHQRTSKPTVPVNTTHVTPQQPTQQHLRIIGVASKTSNLNPGKPTLRMSSLSIESLFGVKGYVALVTGGSSGLGFMISKVRDKSSF